MIDVEHGWNASYKPQFIGLVVSVLLIAASHLIISKEHLSGSALTLTIFGSAIAIALVQLVFFMHLGLEDKPHWYSISFLFAVLVIIIIVGGSLWIMNNLNYNLMPSMPNMEAPHMENLTK